MLYLLRHPCGDLEPCPETAIGCRASQRLYQSRLLGRREQKLSARTLMPPIEHGGGTSLVVSSHHGAHPMRAVTGDPRHFVSRPTTGHQPQDAIVAAFDHITCPPIPSAKFVNTEILLSRKDSRLVNEVVTLEHYCQLMSAIDQLTLPCYSSPYLLLIDNAFWGKIFHRLNKPFYPPMEDRLMIWALYLCHPC